MAIFNENLNNFETNLDGDIQDFKIAMNSKTFKLLSDTLYSDKIKAIIRELSCNAYDSHVDANNTNEQFYIKLPTFLDREFLIRDYGTGMSEERLTNLYLTYGESTKDSSNNFVGCFGIGSKSPFAYTEIFNVKSFYNGEEKVYSVFLNNGIPKCMKISENKTNEKNGIEISFVVEEKDVSLFEKKAIEVFNWFSVKPRCNIELKYSEKTYLIDNNKYSFQEHYALEIFAYQGNIIYPVNLDLINNSVNNNIFKHFVGRIVLKFDIGEFSFSPSREALSYDERTINIINQRLKEAYNDIIDYLFSKLLNFKNNEENSNIFLYATKYYKLISKYKLNNVFVSNPDIYNYTSYNKKYNVLNLTDSVLVNLSLKNYIDYDLYEKSKTTGNIIKIRVKANTLVSKYITKDSIILFNDLSEPISSKMFNQAHKSNHLLTNGEKKFDNIIVINRILKSSHNHSMDKINEIMRMFPKLSSILNINKEDEFNENNRTLSYLDINMRTKRKIIKNFKERVYYILYNQKDYMKGVNYNNPDTRFLSNYSKIYLNSEIIDIFSSLLKKNESIIFIKDSDYSNIVENSKNNNIFKSLDVLIDRELNNNKIENKLNFVEYGKEYLLNQAIGFNLVKIFAKYGDKINFNNNLKFENKYLNLLKIIESNKNIENKKYSIFKQIYSNFRNSKVSYIIDKIFKENCNGVSYSDLIKETHNSDLYKKLKRQFPMLFIGTFSNLSLSDSKVITNYIDLIIDSDINNNPEDDLAS